MLRTIRWILPFAVMAACLPAAQAQVDLSIGVPGVYGRLDLGGYPPPQTIYRQPIVVDRGPGYSEEPLYLHVPPDHARNWRRYCRNYDACGRRVYFVRDDWYRDVYTPHYREAHGRDDHRGPGDRNDHHDDDRRNHDDHGHDDHHGDHGPGDRGPGDRN